ncbi:MAG: FkbM family methyltransferase [Methanoregula sp.]|nr:FkbM family methyltransferase [Methanoregula sp.]
MQTADNVKFLVVDTPFRQITEVPDYRFDDIEKDDIVIDIGANVGAFCIRAAQRSAHVVAVEPVTTGLLRENCRLNRVPVRIIEGALGDGKPHEIAWDDTRIMTSTFPLKKIIAMAGGCDFLKCDCEGAEWQIDPQDLTDIRRIEMELHLPPICPSPNMVLLDQISRYFEFSIDRVPCHSPLGLLGFLHATRR